jgi:hypothetical protein
MLASKRSAYVANCRFKIEAMAFSRWGRSLVTVLEVLVFLLPAQLCDGTESSLAIIDAGVQQSEDAPFVSPNHRFLPGDYVYFTFQITGFSVKSEDRNEVRKISLSYQVTVEDFNSTPLAPPATGMIQTELNPEDKNWTPKRRATFLLPSFIAAGEFHVHVVVNDLVANKQASKDFPFRVGGTRIQPSLSVTVQNFRFLRRENDREALEVPAYNPGDTIYAHFEMVGYKAGADNRYHLAYGLVVLRPDGKPFLQQPKAAELEDGGFYPAQFVPGTIDITTSPNSGRGEYVIILTVRDLVSNQTYETKQGFSLE